MYGVGMDVPYSVILVAFPRQGKEAALHQACLAVVEQSLREPGCTEYRWHRESGDSAKVLLFASWENEEAHDLHAGQAYIKELVAKLGSEDFVERPFVVYCLNQVA